MRIAIAVAAALGLASIVVADPSHAAIKRHTHIPAQSLGPALKDFAESRDLQILYFTNIVRDLKTSGAVGEITTNEALNKILQGTGLTYKYLDDRTITILSEAEETRSQASPPLQVPTSDEKDRQTQLASFWDRLRIAQAASPSTPAASEGGSIDTNSEIKRLQLEEVIVTATKREENLRDIPMSIAVIGAEEIERRGLVGMEDYLRSVPGVNQIDQGPASNAIVIRGITTSPQFENFSSGTSVAMYFDETNITAAGGLGAGSIDVRPVDMARIEVLRGPQGTTFGSASLGGAVRLIPHRPVLNTFASSVSAALSTTGGEGGTNSMVQGMVNVPIVNDRLALRAVAYRFDDSGAYRNVVGDDPAAIALANNFNIGSFISGYTQDDIGHSVSTGARLSAALAISDSVDATFTYLTQDIEQDGWPLATLGGYRQARFPIAAQGRLRGEQGEVDDTEIDLANTVVNFDLGPLALTTVLSRVDSGSQSASTAAVNNPRSSTNRSDFLNTSGEVRLSSTYEGALQFLLGVFYEDLEEEFFQMSNWPGPAGTSPFTTEPILLFEQTRDLSQLAAFGELAYALTERFTLTAGGRWFDYDKNETELREGQLGGAPLGGGVRSTFDSSEAKTSWKASLSFKATEDTMMYATWSQGFRLGRATAGLPTTCDQNGDGIVDGMTITMASTRVVDSDFLDNYEIGTKLAFADRRVLVDAAVYWINWDGMPIRERAICNNVATSYTANVGESISKGVELQLRLLPVQGLQIDIGGSYNRAELSEDALALNAREGAPLPGTPDVNANLGVQYDFALYAMDSFVRADAMYADEFHGDLQETPNTLSGGYTKYDLRAGVKIKNLSIEVYGKNLTDEDAFTWRGLTNTNSFFGYRLRPRTVGIELGYSFK